MTNEPKLPKPSSQGEVEAFLRKVALTPRRAAGGRGGRLIFALDATASRQPTWDRAAQIQAEMFAETAALGGLEVQLVYYRGFREFRASAWVREAEVLLREMTGVFCLAGRTQVEKVLRHALRERGKGPVGALVFVGDCLEEKAERLYRLAGQLGLLGVPCFLFHEGGDAEARQAFEEIARLSGGACCSFDAQSARQLKDLLAAVAVFAAGGRKALADYARGKEGPVRLLSRQLD